MALPLPNPLDSVESKVTSRWPRNIRFIRWFVDPAYHPPLTPQYRDELLRVTRHGAYKAFVGRNAHVLDVEEQHLPTPHSADCKEKHGSDPRCSGCKRPTWTRFFMKVEVDERPQRIVESKRPAAKYKRRRWMSEKKALLIQKKWNKRADKQIHVSPAREVVYYAFSSSQMRILRDEFSNHLKG